jgi:hypothetical protein
MLFVSLCDFNHFLLQALVWPIEGYAERDISLLRALTIFVSHFDAGWHFYIVLCAPNKFHSECTGVILFARQPNSKKEQFISPKWKRKNDFLFIHFEKLWNPGVNLLSGFGSRIGV